MKVITKDAYTGKRVTYDIKQLKTQRPSYRYRPTAKDDKDDELEDLKEKVEELEDKVNELLKSSKPGRGEEEEEPDDEDDTEEEEEIEEKEEVKDLDDSSEECFSRKRDSFRPIGSIMKSSKNDSTSDEQAEIDAWNKRMK